jgi:hypothetical protein
MLTRRIMFFGSGSIVGSHGAGIVGREHRGARRDGARNLAHG